MSFGVWEQVADLLKQNKAPKIKLSPAQEVVPQKRGRGRPRLRDPENPYKHYATPREGYSAPRCFCCKKKLRKTDVVTCSDPCREKTERFLNKTLAAMSGRVRVPITQEAAKHLVETGIARVA